MRLLLTKLENITLIIITIPLTLSPSYLLFLVRLEGYIVNLCDFYSYKIIGKLTSFLHLQEFNLFNLPVTSSTSVVRRSLPTLEQRLTIFSLRLQSYDGAPIESRSHTHPSHSQTSRLLTSSLSLGVPVPHTTQCMSDV